MKPLARLRDEFFPAQDEFDIQRGVRTSGKQSLFWRRVFSGGRKESSRYQPVDEQTFQRSVLGLPRWTFIDMGCGKGRALILAHEAGFRDLIGVEFSPTLCRIARANFAKLGINAAVFNCDAAQFEFPKKPAVLFLYNPFGERIIRNVLCRIGPTPRTVIYINPVHKSAFEELRVITKGSDFEVYSNAGDDGRNLVNT